MLRIRNQYLIRKNQNTKNIYSLFPLGKENGERNTQYMDERDRLVLEVLEENRRILQEEKNKSSKLKGENRKMSSERIESILKEIKASLQRPSDELVGQAKESRKADIKASVLSAAIRGQSYECFSDDDKYILGITDSDASTFIEHDMLEEIVSLKGASVFSDIADVHTENRLEVPVLKYSEKDGAIDFKGELYDFDMTINTTLTTMVSETILNNKNGGKVLDGIENILKMELWQKAESKMFALNDNIYTQITKKVVSASNEPVIEAIKALPESARRNASIIMNFEDYAELIRSSTGNMFENGKFLGKPVYVVEGCIKPIIGDFSKLVLNFAFLKIQNKKVVKKGVYDIVARCAFDFKVVLDEAFVVIE